jgi:hypothetical protein
MLFSGASLLWVLVLSAALYSPIAILTPRILPFPGGLIRWIITIELWALVLCIPVAIGIAEAVMSKGSLLHRLSMIPRAFVHTVALTVALILLLPWIVARWVFVQMKRLKEHRLRVDIDPQMYDSVTEALVAALRGAGLRTKVRELPAPARLSRLALLRLGPPMLRPEAEYEARRIEGDGYSMLVFDGLLDVVADRKLAARVRHSLVGGLPPRGLWLTQTDEARELERYIRSEGADLSTVPARIAEVDATLEESRILSWEYLQALAQREPRAAPPPAAVTQTASTIDSSNRATPPATKPAPPPPSPHPQRPRP